MRQNALALVAGVLFALGLGISGMTQPSRVLGFLDVAGDWDPRLAFVMAGAISVHALAYRALRRQRAAASPGAPPGGAGRALRFPLLADRVDLPARTGVDVRLLAGAAVFGVGWGLAGYCPGPALVSLATGASAVFTFVAAMAAGMALEHLGRPRASGGGARAPGRHGEDEGSRPRAGDHGRSGRSGAASSG